MRIGIALSGGGVRGIAHLGVIKALQENEIYPSLISGISAGGIVGAFIAQGISPLEVLEIISKTSLFKFLRPSFSSTGLLKLELAEALLNRHFNVHTFEALHTPLTVGALNIRTGEIEYFDKGNLILPILASASVPILFNPITLNGQKYIDGGMVENLPVTPLKDNCDFILGVHSNPINKDYTKLTIRGFIERIFLLIINSNARRSMKEVNFLIEPEELKYFRWSDYKKSKELFDIGYKYSLTILSEFQKAIESKEREFDL